MVGCDGCGCVVEWVVGLGVCDGVRWGDGMHYGGDGMGVCDGDGVMGWWRGRWPSHYIARWS